MAASPQVVQDNPYLLTGRQDIYSAPDFRKPLGDAVGAGVADADSFRIRQRAAGANMSVDVVAPNVNNRAWVRASQTLDLGMYRVDFLNATQVNLDVPASDGALPRVDQVFLTVEDSQIVGGMDRATVRLVPGVPTSGATLDNRTGVGAVPANMASILLADILVPNGSTTVVTANIRDRRHTAVENTVPTTDAVTFMPHQSLLTFVNASLLTTAKANNQSAALMYLPRRKYVTGIQWKYLQSDSGAATNSWSIGIFGSDKVRRAHVSSVAYVGSISQGVAVAAALTAGAGWFEPGMYYILFGTNTPAGGNNIDGYGVSSKDNKNNANAANTFLYKAGGGLTVPDNLLTGWADAFTDVASSNAYPGVPIITLT